MWRQWFITIKCVTEYTYIRTCEITPKSLQMVTDAEAETPILCPSDVKNRLIGEDPDAGKD